MPAESPMVLVERGIANAWLAHLDTLNLAGAGIVIWLLVCVILSVRSVAAEGEAVGAESSASPARPGEGMGALRAAPSIPTETVIRGLRLIAEHFAVTTPLQRECNVRGWPNMAADTSEVFSQCATEAADRLAALTRSADK